MSAPNDVESYDALTLIDAAAKFYRMRRARDRLIPEELTGEPGWDILLALFAESPEHLPISSACFSSGVPQSTALRWVATLEGRKLVERRSHSRDNGLMMLALTDEGARVVERCITAMLRAGCLG